MQLDFEVQRCTRRCAATDRPLESGDLCFTVLEVAGADIIRKDFCHEAWNGPPETAFGWWRSRVPELNAKKIKLAPNDVLLELFDQLADQPENQDMRYVLTLLLLRRRVLRLDTMFDERSGPRGQPRKVHSAELMAVHCPKRDATYEVYIAMPTSTRIDEIQQQLSDLLIADAE